MEIKKIAREIGIFSLLSLSFTGIAQVVDDMGKSAKEKQERIEMIEKVGQRYDTNQKKAQLYDRFDIEIPFPILTNEQYRQAILESPSKQSSP